LRKTAIETRAMYTVVTSRLVLRWMCDSPRTGCARRTTLIYICGAKKQ